MQLPAEFQAMECADLPSSERWHHEECYYQQDSICADLSTLPHSDQIGHIQDGMAIDNTPSFRVFMEQRPTCSITQLTHRRNLFFWLWSLRTGPVCFLALSPFCFLYFFLSFLHCFYFEARVSLCSPGWSRTHHPLALGSVVLGFIGTYSILSSSVFKQMIPQSQVLDFFFKKNPFPFLSSHFSFSYFY